MHFERLHQLSSKPVSQALLAHALYYTGDTARAEALFWGLQSSAPSEQRGRALLASFLAARTEARITCAGEGHNVACVSGSSRCVQARRDVRRTRPEGGLPLGAPGGRHRFRVQRLVLEGSTPRSAANGPGFRAVHQLMARLLRFRSCTRTRVASVLAEAHVGASQVSKIGSRSEADPCTTEPVENPTTDRLSSLL